MHITLNTKLKMEYFVNFRAAALVHKTVAEDSSLIDAYLI